MRRRAALVCACLAPFGWAMFWAVFHGVPGQDWVVFHTAAARVTDGDLATLYHGRAFTDVLNRTHAAWLATPLVFHPWVYPPVALLIALAFGWLDYLPSLAVFLGVTAGLLAAALWRWQDRPSGRFWLLAGVAACPATAFTLGSGQLSFLVAACVVAGVAWLPSRPVLAGLVLSALCMKPQFALLIPVALLAGRHWRAIAGGCAGGLALVLASVALAGIAPWAAWLRLTLTGDPELGRLIDAVRQYDQSVHTALRALGAGEGLAGAGQVAALACSAACVALAFGRRVTPRTRLAVLLCAMVFGSPHVGDYDCVLTAIAATMMLIDGRHVWLSAALWLSTGFNPPALIAVLGVPALTAASALSVLLAAGLMAALLADAPQSPVSRGRRPLPDAVPA